MQQIIPPLYAPNIPRWSSLSPDPCSGDPNASIESRLQSQSIGCSKKREKEIVRLFDATMEERFNRWACYLAAAVFAGAPDGRAEGGVTVSQSISSARPQSSSSGFRLPIVAETKSILPGRPSAWGAGAAEGPFGCQRHSCMYTSGSVKHVVK